MIEIKEIRKKLIESIETSGMKKADICRALGITSATMAQYKSGKAMPSLDTLANLCRIIDVSPAYILCFEDEAGRKVLNTKDQEVFIYEDGTHKITHKK